MDVTRLPTPYQAFAHVAGQMPRNVCFAHKEHGRWRTQSYADALATIDRLAAGFAAYGIAPGTHVGLWAPNSPAWAMSDFALNRLGAVSVPVHAVANQVFVEALLEDAHARYLIVEHAIYQEHAAWLAHLPLERIIIIGARADSKERVVPWQSCIAPTPATAPPASDTTALATLVYTSGTTGKPKGVMLTNRNLLANVAGVQGAVPAVAHDIFLSFLPLSHAFERMAGHFVPLLVGASVYYAENIRELKKNIAEVQPTVLVAVPKVFERMYERVFATAKATPLKKKLFFWSLHKHKYSALEWIAERIVFRSIRHKVVGKRLRLAVCGGAGIADYILKFFDKVGVRVLQGYGLTETSPVVAVNRLHANHLGTVGQPLDNVRVETTPEKEVIVQGPSVMAGYWNNSAETAAVLRDGWFHTGDLGFIDEDGFVTIIGRKKDCIVTSNGKNISPETLESMLNVEKGIAQSVVVGHGRDHLVALIVPEERFRALPSDELRARVKRDVERVNKRLPHYEHVRDFALVLEPFTMENEEITPTLKVRRAIIERRYEKIISRLYS